MKGGTATGWQGRGFEDNDAVKEFALDTSRGFPHRALQERAAFSGQVIDMDPRFVDRFGGPADDHHLMLPLAVERQSSRVGLCGLRTGVRIALDTACYRIAGGLDQRVAGAGFAAQAGSARRRRLTLTAFRRSLRCRRALEFQRSLCGTCSATHGGGSRGTSSIRSRRMRRWYPVHAAAARWSETHPLAYRRPHSANKTPMFIARRSGSPRLLVDEIKLYNQAKVAEGRKNKDLYDRSERRHREEPRHLSRSVMETRRRRVWTTFRSELVRSLAEDDISVMGANFRR